MYSPGEFDMDVNYNPERTDTYSSSTAELIGNSPVLNENYPIFSGTSNLPEYELNAYNQSVTECLGKIANDKANFSESIATAKQTVNMLADTSVRLLGALAALKRGHLSAIPKNLGLKRIGRNIDVPGLPGYWLEYQYGWKPLLSDVEAAYNAVASLEPKALLINAKRVVKGSNAYDSTQYIRERETTWKRKSEFYHTCELWGRVSDQFMREANKYGLANPATLAWELVPYSFVVDWFMPVGNVLSAWSATSGLEFVSGYTSVRCDAELTIDIGHTPYPYVTDTSLGKHKVKRFGFRRDKLESWPNPNFYVKNPFTTAHTANALALFYNLLR